MHAVEAGGTGRGDAESVPPRSVAIVMMIAPDHDLEWQAVLLGASVREFMVRPVNLYFCIEPDHLPLLGAETRALIQRYFRIIDGADDADEELQAFAAARDFPARIQCATLAWEYLERYLKR